MYAQLQYVSMYEITIVYAYACLIFLTNAPGLLQEKMRININRGRSILKKVRAQV